MLQNRNHGEHAVFVPTRGGNFARYNSETGQPWPVGPGDAHGLHDRDGRMHYGPLPAGMALDAMPSLWDKTSDARDQGNGGGALGASQLKAARDLHGFMKTRLSPEDHGQFSDLMLQYLHRLAGGEANAEGEDQTTGSGPPAFPGGPTPGGVIGADPHERPRMASDSALAFDAEFPNVRRLAQSDDHYGVQAEPTRKQRQAVALALDAASGGRQPEETNPDLRDALASVARIGRCY